MTDSLSVVLRKNAMEKLEDLLGQLRKNPLIEEVNYGKGEWETMSSLTHTVRWVGLALGGVIFLTALFIVSNTIALALWARKEDLLLYSRMGAPSWMRWGPYMFEGVFQGFIGALAVVLLLELLRHVLGLALLKIGGFEALLTLPEAEWRNLYWDLALLGGALGATGAFLALRRKWIKDLL